MGRRARTQSHDDDGIVDLSTHLTRKQRNTKRGPGRSAARPTKQSHRERAAADTAREHYGSTLKGTLPTIPRTAAQEEHLTQLRENRVVLATGPAGTGKTYIPVAFALDLLAAGEIEQIIFLRPAVEAGRSLGFLPGKLEEKLDPFFAPIRRSVSKKIGSAAYAERWLKSAQEAGTVVFGSIQHLRGETLERCMVILDEPQNCTYSELKLVLTRMGELSRFAFCGDDDPWQNDIGADKSGWPELVARLAPLTDWVGVTRYTKDDVVRDPLLRRILPYL